jgi:hypothetical protein
VGHDLSRGPANYMRPRPQRVNAGDELPDDESDVSPEDTALPGEPDDMLDEAAIEQLSRDLDNAELGAEDQDKDEASRVGVPAPF